MGGLFAKNKKSQSRVTQQDKAILQLKQQRDRLKQYQKRIELSLQNDRLLARKCLCEGRKERALLLLRKKKFQETLLNNTDKQLDNLEKLAADIEFAQVEIQVLDGLKQGNIALKKMHAILDVNEIEKVMDDTREGIEKQQEIDSLLSDVLTQEDEESVLAELDALTSEQGTEIQLPDVPTDKIPNDVQEGRTAKEDKTNREGNVKVLLEA